MTTQQAHAQQLDRLVGGTPAPAAETASRAHSKALAPNLFETLAEYALLISLLWLPLIYFVNTALPLTRLTAVLFLFMGLQQLAVRRRRIQLDPLTVKVIAVALIFSSYMLLVDAYQNDLIQGVKDLLNRLAVFLVLPASEIMGFTDKRRLRRILLLSLVPMLFGTLQIFDSSLNVPALWPDLPLFHASGLDTSTSTGAEGVANYIEYTGRVVGTGNIAIGLGLLLGIVFVLAALHTSGGRRVFLLAWTLCVLYFTFTRSAVWGITIPILVMMFWNYRLPQRRGRLIGILAGLALIAGGVVGVVWLSASMSVHASRLLVALDANTLVKLASAYGGIVDTLHVSPLVGIPQSDAYMSFVRAFASLPESLFPAQLTLNSTVTNHNQFIYYLRYYGLIGLALVTYLHWLVWKKINAKADPRMRLTLAAIFLYFVQYSLLHNVFLTSYTMIWLLLAVGAQQYHAPAQSAAALSPHAR
jgi:hypothetical protein